MTDCNHYCKECKHYDSKTEAKGTCTKINTPVNWDDVACDLFQYRMRICPFCKTEGVVRRSTFTYKVGCMNFDCRIHPVVECYPEDLDITVKAWNGED